MFKRNGRLGSNNNDQNVTGLMFEEENYYFPQTVRLSLLPFLKKKSAVFITLLVFLDTARKKYWAFSLFFCVYMKIFSITLNPKESRQPYSLYFP